MLPLTALDTFCWLAKVFVQQPAVPSNPADDDFAPILLPLMLIVIAVCLVLVGVGIVLALAGIVCAAILIALGIISSSAVFALLRRRVSAGVRLFHYQICAALGTPGGIALLWGASALFGLQIRLRSIVLLGAAAGLAAGLLLAGVFDWAARVACRRLLALREPRDGATPVLTGR